MDQHIYTCPTCSSHDPDAYVRCQHPGCPDGRDKRPFRQSMKEAVLALRRPPEIEVALLRWEVLRGTWRKAETFIGRYTVAEHGNWWLRSGNQLIHQDEAPSQEAGMIAAQDHFDRCVKSVVSIKQEG